MKKLTLLAVGAVGYVLGSRAGRERYEQIKTQADKVWSNPKVQSTVDDVQAQAKQAASDAGSAVGSKVAEAAGEAKAKVSEKVHGSSTDPASDDYLPDDELVGPPPVPGGPSVIAESARKDS